MSIETKASGIIF